MNTQVCFVTATDTDAGKTVVSSVLLHRGMMQGKTTLGLKPVAAGASRTPDGLRNEDACCLMEVSTVKLPYTQVNPVCLEPAVAPHIAAARAGLDIPVDKLATTVAQTLDTVKPGLALVEGAGGWRVPLNDREDLSALAIRLQLPVILVVNLRLGCLSVARLTAEAIIRDGGVLAGWIGNHNTPDVMSEEQANLDTLVRLLPAPCLGVLPFTPSPMARLDDLAGCLRWPGEA